MKKLTNSQKIQRIVDICENSSVPCHCGFIANMESRKYLVVAYRGSVPFYYTLKAFLELNSYRCGRYSRVVIDDMLA